MSSARVHKGSATKPSEVDKRDHKNLVIRLTRGGSKQVNMICLVMSKTTDFSTHLEIDKPFRHAPCKLITPVAPQNNSINK